MRFEGDPPGGGSARKPALPVLLYGGSVLTLDAVGTVLPEAEVLLHHGRVGAVGRAITAVPGTRPVDVHGCLVVPGLIQGHVHLGQTFFRGLAEGRRLLDWLRDRIWPLEAAHDDDSAYWCTLLGAAECLLSGTTTVGDIGLGPGARGHLAALADSGLRGFGGPCLMDAGDELPAALRGTTDDVLTEAERLGDELERSAEGHRLRYSLNPRFILTGTDALYRGIRELSARRGWPVHTHALEQAEETAAVRAAKNGRDEIEYFDEEGLLDRDLRVAHGVQLEPRHHERLAAAPFSVVHCPSSNLKLGSGVADVVGLGRSGIPVGLGCDGAACANHFDAFEELRLAALLQKRRHGPESFSGLDALRLATSQGAKALGLQSEVGSLELGKAADVVVLATDRPDLWAAPGVDLHDLVAFSASRAHVRHVFIDGEQVVEDGRLVALDMGRIRRRADAAVRQLLERVD